MATIDLGRLGFVNKGTYNNSTTYEKNDLVQFTDGGILSTYLYIDSTAQSGQAPSSSGTAGSRWVYFAKGVADAVASAGNNKILVTDGSGSLSPLSIGSAGQSLKVNSGANGFEFGTISSGNFSVHAFDNYSHNTNVNYSGNQTTYIDIANGQKLTFTPTSTSDYIFFHGWTTCYIGGSDKGGSVYVMYGTNSTISSSDTKLGYKGTHAHYGGGNGNRQDEYSIQHVNLILPCTSLTANTTYYAEMAGSSHSNSGGGINFGEGIGSMQTGTRHNLSLIHFKSNS